MSGGVSGLRSCSGCCVVRRRGGLQRVRARIHLVTEAAHACTDRVLDNLEPVIAEPTELDEPGGRMDTSMGQRDDSQRGALFVPGRLASIARASHGQEGLGSLSGLSLVALRGFWLWRIWTCNRHRPAASAGGSDHGWRSKGEHRAESKGRTRRGQCRGAKKTNQRAGCQLACRVPNPRGGTGTVGRATWMDNLDIPAAALAICQHDPCCILSLAICQLQIAARECTALARTITRRPLYLRPPSSLFFSPKMRSPPGQVTLPKRAELVSVRTLQKRTQISGVHRHFPMRGRSGGARTTGRHRWMCQQQDGSRNLLRSATRPGSDRLSELQRYGPWVVSCANASRTREAPPIVRH
jgi:hypothetical protein